MLIEMGLGESVMIDKICFFYDYLGFVEVFEVGVCELV